MKSILIAGLLGIFTAVVTTVPSQGQDASPKITVITRAHWNMDMEEFSMDEWKKLESEYHEKVTMKNEFIKNSNVLLHYYTPDNSELLLCQTYNSWVDVEKANERSMELSEQAWPNEDERTAFFNKQRAFYSNMHSDEIYQERTLGKALATVSEEPLIYYMRTTHRAEPKDGSPEEIAELRKEYVENVLYKNEDMLGYYPMRHMYGADAREMLDVFVFKSMKELEEMNDSKLNDLAKAQWPDEEKRKAFMKSFNKYYSPWHGDLIYSSIPELSK